MRPSAAGRGSARDRISREPFIADPCGRGLGSRFDRCLRADRVARRRALAQRYRQLREDVDALASVADGDPIARADGWRGSARGRSSRAASNT